MNISNQLAQGIIATKARINIVVVLGIVLVVRGRGEDRIQVENIDAKRALDVSEFRIDALQITAKEDRILRITSIGIGTLTPVFMLGWCTEVAILVGLNVVTRVAIIETVGKDLVHDTILGPI